MNTSSVIGRLTQDPELRELPSGTSVCKLRLAVKGMGRGGPKEVGYINVSTFGDGALAAAKRLTQGWLVAVSGRLEWHEWDADDGTRRHDYELIGQVQFLSAPRGDDEEPETVDADVEEGEPVAF
jgi:single-strand DNA-binding protein